MLVSYVDKGGASCVFVVCSLESHLSTLVKLDIAILSSFSLCYLFMYVCKLQISLLCSPIVKPI